MPKNHPRPLEAQRYTNSAFPMDEVTRSVYELESQEIQEVRLVIAVDYGTTFTGSHSPLDTSASLM